MSKILIGNHNGNSSHGLETLNQLHEKSEKKDLQLKHKRTYNYAGKKETYVRSFQFSSTVEMFCHNYYLDFH